MCSLFVSISAKLIIIHSNTGFQLEFDLALFQMCIDVNSKVSKSQGYN